MKLTVKLLLVAVLVIAIIVPISLADEIGAALNPPTVKVVYDGKTDIKTVLDSKVTEAEKISTLGTSAKTVMEKETYPYTISSTEIKILKTRYDEKTQTMWYWIEATRNGQEVAVNNPIWVYPAPKDVVVSTSFDVLRNELTITKKEDPKAAIEAVLKQYVDRRPLGKSVVTEE